jgi:hypothetical protein
VSVPLAVVVPVPVAAVVEPVVVELTVVPPLVVSVLVVTPVVVVVELAVVVSEVEAVEPTATAVDGVTAVATFDCAAMFGTLLGTWSDSLTPPQPATAAAVSDASATTFARRERGLAAQLAIVSPRRDPCAVRRSGSR